MKFGFFCPHEQHAPSTLLDHAELAENVGFDSVWTSDHFHPWWHSGAHCGAAWPWLGTALERTDKVEFATGVTPPIARYHPGLLTQWTATLNAMHPGRFRVTFATGEAMNEEPLGYEWPDYPERRARLVDACRIYDRLVTGEFASYDGHYWSLDDARLYTVPEERPPLYVAGNGVHTAEVAGRYADGFLTLADVETYENELVPALEAGAADAGRDPDEISRTKQLTVSYDEEYAAAVESAEFWSGTVAVDFDDAVSDPREIERQGRALDGDDWTDEWGVVTDDFADVERVVDEHENAGFDEIEFLSSSPSQATFAEKAAERLF
ncbi:LLM class flavin-dependent oxidoreductase [Halocalculus aciditolerans]|uniref:F420-dependent glucose-6-phosphate dehydrogenase n=1 Tax=Halocalculus aciditolerans TaxID=1383812 RepID=A0A830FEK0_9EURY|nr:LLM class flavin-dependent oxidoreductase [Halocalculus aciditolerans]GGL47190.1 F420-dependent glucose-6-phosphate dehydrogenase [Halocalculus aciditolerans]